MLPYEVEEEPDIVAGVWGRSACLQRGVCVSVRNSCKNAVQTSFPSFDRHLIPLGRRRVGQGKGGRLWVMRGSPGLGGICAQAGICMWLGPDPATILPSLSPLPKLALTTQRRVCSSFPLVWLPTCSDEPATQIAPKRERKTVSSSKGL